MDEISQEILKKASQGDRESFRFIYDKTSNMVYAVAFRLSQSKEDAKEIMQDVFLKVYYHLHQFEFKSSFKKWLYKITFNTAITFLKKNAKWKKTVSFDESYYEKSEISLNDDHELLKEQRIQELLSQLNPEQRACMILRVGEGMKYAEIAEVLKINVNTVRTRILRARKILLAYKKKKRGTF